MVIPEEHREGGQLRDATESGKAKTAAGEIHTLSKQKAFPFYPCSMRLGVRPEEGRLKCNRSQNGTGVAGPKRPVSLAWGKKGLEGRWTHPKHAEFWEVDWSF